MLWHRLRFVLLLAWAAMLVVAAPLALRVTHNLSQSGLGDPRSSAAWADAQLAALPPAPPETWTLLVQGMPTASVRAVWTSIAGGAQERATAAVAAASVAVRSAAPSAGRREAGRHTAAALAPSVHITPLAGHAMTTVVDVSASGVAAPAQSAWSDAVSALQSRLQARPGASVRAVNPGSIGDAIQSGALSTLKTSGLLALPVLALLLLLVFDSAVAAALPLVAAVVGSIVALAVIDLLESRMQLSVYVTNIVSFLSLGVGIDYSLFLSSRFRAALRRTGDAAAALHEAMRTAGRSVFFSAVAVGLSMLALLVPRTSYWRGLAIGGCVGVLSVLLATLTLLPALLALLGPRIERGRIPVGGWLAGFWPGVARAVTWRPALVLAVGVAALAVPALLSPRIAIGSPADEARMLGPHSVLRLAAERQQVDFGLGSQAPLPLAVLPVTPLSQARTWTALQALTQRLQHLPGVADVSSPAPAAVPAAALAAAWSAPGGPPAALRSAVTPGGVIALSVTSRFAPDDARTLALLSRLEGALQTLPAGWRSGVGGAVAIVQSFDGLVLRSLPPMLAVVGAVAFVILFAASGSVWIALTAVAFDGLVAATTAGVLVYAVQQGHWGFAPAPINSAIAPLIFVVLFGLSMDYEVILIHRIREHAAAGAPAAAAARRGLEETGGMVTGAGLIMVVVFAAMWVSPLQIMRTLAAGMTVAILLDTWIVRTCLVPTSVALLGRSAWWPLGPRAGGAGARAK